MTSMLNWCESILLYTVAFLAGITIGILGPSLPDISCLLQIELDTSSYLVFLQGAGFVAGQLTVAEQIERIPVYINTSIIAFLLVIFNGFFTFSPNIYSTCVLTFASGIAVGQSVTVAAHRLNILWPGQGRCIQLLFTSTGAGSLVGPLCLAPFLSDGAITLSMYPAVTRTMNRHASFQLASGEQNTTFNNDTLPKANNTEKEDESLLEDSDTCITLITITYLIFAACSVVTLMFSLLLYFKQRSKFDSKYDDLDDQRQIRQYTAAEYVFIGVMCVYSLVVQSVLIGFSFLLSTFGTESLLALSLNKMTLMTSLFWFSFTISRLLASIFSGKLDEFCMIIICYSGMFFGNLALSLSLRGEWLLWLSSITLGFFLGPTQACGLNWTNAVVSLTPKIIAAYLLSTGVGMFIPFLVGILMAQLNMNVFLFFPPLLYLLNLFVLAIAFWLSQKD